MKNNMIKKMIAFVLLITLCIAGLPAQKVQAAENTGLTVSDELESPVITSLKNTYRYTKVCWSKVDDADYYCIYRKQSYLYNHYSDKDWEKIEETDECEFLDNTFQSVLTYEYKIRAVRIDKDNNKILSPVSASKSILRLNKPLIKIKNSSKGISLSLYEANGLFKGIIVYRKGPGESAYTRVAKVAGSQYTDTDIMEGETYSYKICMYRGSSKSPVSKVKTIICTKP